MRRSRSLSSHGDLGFRALEPLRDRLGSRFINAGVAEQNIVSVSAGLARSGLRPWATALRRSFTRDLSSRFGRRLPAQASCGSRWNGGGYGYGVMGATHHAIEDYGVLLALPHMRAFVPAFDADVGPVIARLMSIESPAYLRLGLSEEPKGFVPPAYTAWRRLIEKGPRGATILVVGPLVGGISRRRRTLQQHSDQACGSLARCQLPISLQISLTTYGARRASLWSRNTWSMGAPVKRSRPASSRPALLRVDSRTSPHGDIRPACMDRRSFTARSAVWTRCPSWPSHVRTKRPTR